MKKNIISLLLREKAFSSFASDQEIPEALKAILTLTSSDPIQSKKDLKQRLSVLPLGTVKIHTKGVEILGAKRVETQLVSLKLTEKISSAVPRGAGAIIAVSANGNKSKVLPFGRTSVEGGHEPDRHTAALIGSGAKMFTGILSKILEQKKYLSLETKLSDVMNEKHLAIFANPEKAKNIR